NWAKETISPKQLQQEFDAVVLTGGAEQSRDLPVPGRDLDGVHFAMEFLPQQNKVNAGEKVKGQIRADGKHVIVIGGGDTGSDCVGTSNRHGAMGFVSPVQTIVEGFGVDQDARGNAKATTDFHGGYATNVPKVFAAGDMRRGQSLVVWAIREGRQAARAVDEFLMGFSDLPR